MPNYCENKLVVVGQPEDLKRFVDKYFVDGKLDFNKVVPEPTSIENCPTKYVNLEYKHNCNAFWFDWVNWRRDYWGTIRNVYDNYLNIKDCFIGNLAIDYRFDTAWSPPIPIIQKMAIDFPKIHISLYYYEPGMCFAGIYNSTDGDWECDPDKLHQFAIDYMDYSKEDFDEV